jgi:hypothetical protein
MLSFEIRATYAATDIRQERHLSRKWRVKIISHATCSLSNGSSHRSLQRQFLPRQSLWSQFLRRQSL